MNTSNPQNTTSRSLEEIALQYLQEKGVTSVHDLHAKLWAARPTLTRAETTNLLWRLAEQGRVELDYFPETSFVEFLKHWFDSIRTASRYVSIVAMPLAFALLATARPALTLLVGNSYQGGVIPLAVLALGSIATIVAFSFGPVLIVLNETTLAALASMLPIPFGVAVTFILIPILGVSGAAIARALSMLLGLVLTWHFVRRKIAFRLDYRAIMKSVVASGGSLGHGSPSTVVLQPISSPALPLGRVPRLPSWDAGVEGDGPGRH